jgi:hypothetical protein
VSCSYRSTRSGQGWCASSPSPDPLRANAPRLATIVAEQLVVERTDVATSVSDTFRLPTSVVDVNVRATPGLAPPQPPFSFEIRTAQGQVLASAEVSPADLAAARATWHSWTRAAVVGVLGLTILLCAAPLLEARRHARRPVAFVLTTGALVACLAIGRTLLRAAFLPVVGGSIGGPAELLPDALFLTALVWLAIDTVERRRVSRPRAHLIVNERAATFVTVAAFSAAGAVAAAGLWGVRARSGRDCGAGRAGSRELLASSIRSGTSRRRSGARAAPRSGGLGRCRRLAASCSGVAHLPPARTAAAGGARRHGRRRRRAAGRCHEATVAFRLVR